MCTRGIFQLRKLHLQFCDYGGSSKGVREFLESDALKDFVKKNPQIEFKFLRRRGTHPFISSVYINGYIKDVPLRNLPSEDIIHEFDRVKNSFGRKALPHAGNKVTTLVESIQGQWRPNLFGNYPKHELEKVTVINYEEINLEHKPVDEDYKFKRLQDNIHKKIWKFKPVSDV